MFDADRYEISGYMPHYTVSAGSPPSPLLDCEWLSVGRDAFQFVTSDGTEVLRVETDRVLDAGAIYELTDPQTESTVGTIRRGMASSIRPRYEFRDASGELVGTLTERGRLRSLARRLGLGILSTSYDLRGPYDATLGEMQGLPGLPTRYRILLTSDLDPRFPIVAAVLTNRFDAADPTTLVDWLP